MNSSPSTDSTRLSSSNAADEEAFLQERVYELSTYVDRLTRYKERITQLLLDVVQHGEPEQAAQARKLLKESGWARFCHYCGELATTTDHIVPVSLGGMDVRLNQADACIDCNKEKGNRLPEPHCPRCVRAVEWHSANSLRFKQALRERKAG